mmetsp:Transcript_20112/g.44029  ORF Transcript_20112/g.44029 Transcript_20112/m.44029 type:complete len:271 (+) Transcript_20112:1461-2273(+)
MVAVGDGPLDAVGDELVEAEQGVVAHQVPSVGDADLVAKIDECLERLGVLLHVPLEGVRDPREPRHLGDLDGLDAGVGDGVLQPADVHVGVLDVGDEALLVEVDVGERGEHRLVEVLVRLGVRDVRRLFCVHAHPRQPLQAVQQQVLQRRHLGGLPAHPHRLAPGAVFGLFALVTEHRRICGRCGGIGNRAAGEVSLGQRAVGWAAGGALVRTGIERRYRYEFTDRLYVAAAFTKGELGCGEGAVRGDHPEGRHSVKRGDCSYLFVQRHE